MYRPDGAVVSFGYDALGRRIWKNYRQTTTHWHWDGNVPLHECKGFVSKDPLSENLITWIFEEDSFSPIAKLRGEKKYSILADHLGTPIEAYADDGNLVWERSLNANGKVLKETGIQNFCPFLYQGQSFDNEIELAYNRFRYYDVEDGRYISQDPIGLLGGLAFYNYVHDTNEWLDLFGLSSYAKKNKKTSHNAKSRRDAFRQAKRDAGIPNSQKPSRVFKEPLLDGDGNKMFDSNGKMIETRNYEFTRSGQESITIQEHSLGHTKATQGHGAESHFNVRPNSNTNTGSVQGTHGHYNF